MLETITNIVVSELFLEISGDLVAVEPVKTQGNARAFSIINMKNVLLLSLLF